MVARYSLLPTDSATHIVPLSRPAMSGARLLPVIVAVLLAAATSNPAAAHVFPDTVWVKKGGTTTFSVLDTGDCAATVWIDDIADPGLIEITPMDGYGIEVEFTVRSLGAAGVTTIIVQWQGEHVGKDEGHCREDTTLWGGFEIVIRVTPDEVNSEGNRRNREAGDGHCDTGKNIERDGKEEPECTLRAAIQENNAGSWPGVIAFDIPGPSPYIIAPASPLPQIDRTVTIVGSGDREISISGSGAGAGASGFVIAAAAPSSIIENLVITGFGGNGVLIQGDESVIKRCDIEHNDGSGIFITGGALFVVVGGEAADDGNTIFGNGRYGVEIEEASFARVISNTIGMHLPGLEEPNQLGGVLLGGMGQHAVGLPSAVPGEAPGNVIDGNGPEGAVVIRSDDNAVRGNLIGRIPDAPRGMARQASGNQGPGVSIEGANNRIGGEDEVDANVIAGNETNGVEVIGMLSVGNTIRRNVIYDNGELAIDLGGDGPTPNDLGDGVSGIDDDSGANDLLNYPVALVAARDVFNPESLIISGILETPNPANAIIEIYSSEEPGAAQTGSTRFGHGQVFVDTTRARPDGIIRKRIPAGLLPHPIISATATDANGSTSEFSWVCYDTTGDGSVDSDGDSLCDNWEAHGIDYNGDGVIDLDLAALGASPTVRDLFVEVDWMQGHEPIAAGIEDVKTAFANAPTRINLHVLKDEQVPLIDLIQFGGTGNGTFQGVKHGTPVKPCGGGPTGGRFGTAADRAADNCAARIGARRLAYRYGIYGANYAEGPGSSGIAELIGNDFLVTVGGWSAAGARASAGLGPGAPVAAARRILEASTLMHEFGHNLGLEHGGWDARNCKPNYPSVMSYSLQFPGMVPGRVMDYSRTRMADLNEAALNERAGLDGPANRLVLWRVPATEGRPAQLLFASARLARIDWNDNGVTEPGPLALDINNIPVAGCNGPREVGLAQLNGFSDWANITFDFRSYRGFASGAAPEIPDDHTPERTEEDIVAAALEADFDGDGIPNALDNCPTIYNPDQTDTSGDGIGDACEGPMADVAVLQEATFDQANGNVTFELTVYNFGPEIATHVVLADTLSSKIVPGEVVSSEAECSLEGRFVRCDVATLAVGDSVMVAVSGSVLETGLIENTAHVSYTYDPNPYNNSFDLEVEATSVSIEGGGEVPEKFRLHASYPNPFTDRTVISFDMPEAAHVHLAVIDLLGRRVSLLVNEIRGPGQHTVTFDGSALAPGLYLYRFEVGDYSLTRRFTILR